MSILNDFLEDKNILENPGLAYHYCGLSALHSIIHKTKSMWATDFRYLNDNSENVYGLNILRKYLSKK